MTLENFKAQMERHAENLEFDVLERTKVNVAHDADRLAVVEELLKKTSGKEETEKPKKTTNVKK